MHSISKLPMTLLLSNDSCCCGAVPGFYITQHIGKSQSCFWPLITAALQHIRLLLWANIQECWAPDFVFIAVQHRMLTNFSVITYLNATLHALSCSYSVGKKKVKSKHTYWHQNCDESVKKKNQFSEFDFAQRLQQTCYESIWSRSIRHPSYNVLVPALRFFFFYLVQSHFVVFQPLPSHILCLWLSLDFSQTDKLISFIHT